MKFYLILSLLFFSNLSLAKSPISNGEYIGEVNCLTSEGDAFKDQVSVTFTENQVFWRSLGDSGPINHTLTLILGEHDFFQMLDDGVGYFTSNGIHYETNVQGIKTEDTYVVDGYDLHYISSSKLPRMRIKCSSKMRRNFIF